MKNSETDRSLDFISKNNLNESSIITRTSFDDKCFSDAESSSLDTVATQQERDVTETQISVRRNRSETITQDNNNAMIKIAASKQIIDEQDKSTMGLVDGLQQMEDETSYSDSDNSLEEPRNHIRNKSHHSTMSSIHSYISSASNYDILLARLDNNGTLFMQDSAEELPWSIDTKEEKMTDDFDWEFWSRVISDFNNVSKSESKLLSLQIQRGIPPSLRGMVWQLFTKSKDMKLEDQYMQLLKEESVYEKAIIRDLLKIPPLKDENQEALFNIIKAYSLYDKDVGYSQNLLYITLPLLLNMPEEEGFCVLVQLMNKYRLRAHYLLQSDLLQKQLYQLQGLIGDHLPHLQRHFEAHNIKTNVYAYQWFNTLFTYKFPMEVVYRIYDAIFAEDITFVFHLSLALLEKNQSTLLCLEYENLTDFLKNNLLLIYQDDIGQIIHDAFQINIDNKRLNRLAREFQIESSKSNNEAEIVESLRKQNKQLQESIRQMDHDYTKLNKDHVILTNELITIKMDVIRIHNENESFRQQTLNLKKTLETLPAEVEARVKEEMEILYTKNAALVERNSALEDQLAYMENMIIEIKVKHTDSENEREGLRQRLADLKCLMEK